MHNENAWQVCQIFKKIGRFKFIQHQRVVNCVLFLVNKLFNL